MLNDKVTVVANPARGMGRACTLASARGFRLGLARSALAVAVAALLPLYAAAQVGQGTAVPQIEQADSERDFDLPAGSLAAALEAFSTQSGIRLDSPPRLLAGKQARAVNGRMGWHQALDSLLQDSGLEFQQTGGTTVMIGEARKGTAPGGRSARTGPEVTVPPTAATDLAAITVTGTRIRGGTTPSPVITIGSEHIKEEGFTDLGEVIRSIPQNFSGGQNPGVAGGATVGAGGLANQNLTGGAGLNLRGLGPDASLTLLNGRRMAYGGFVQAIDISAIPVEAVERIDILPDGASAIYGSDAVGGVGNVILHRDYKGVAVGVRYGGATEGGRTTREYTVTAGAVWSNGSLIAAYKNASTGAIYARQREYTSRLAEPSTVYPESDLRSGLLSLHQSLGNKVELRLDALRTERDQTFYPYNTSLLSYYNVMTPESRATLVSPEISISLPNDWTLQLGMGWGKDRLLNRQTRVNIATAVPTPLSNECFCNKIRTYEAGAEGPLFALPGGDARLAVGFGYRRNEFAQHSHMTGTTAIQGSESSRFAYAETSLPILGGNANISGVQRLALNVAIRGEDYESFGSVTTPKVGFIYSPTTDFTLKASWGRAFKAPTLFQRYVARSALLRAASFYGGADHPAGATVLLLSGGNPNLGAETARTRSASLVFHPEALQGLEAELTFFDIDYIDRVVQPITNFSQALGNPHYAHFISYSPTFQEQEDMLASANNFYNLTGRPYSPGSVVAILYSHYANVARQRVRGVDLSAVHRLDIGTGRLTIRGSSSLLDSSQQSTPSQDAYDLAGTIFNPAKINSRLGAVWAQGGLSTSGFVNYTSGVTSTLIAGTTEKTSSFTTFDVTIRYETGWQRSAWSGLEFTLAAQNVFNREPPFYTPRALDHPPYDSTNYSSIGRFLSLSIVKRF